MAVVSISRIQIRRGKKTDLPQLASGEFGWSIDSQELYIGNGAVSEGSPYVGNTKLLSEHDNLFQFANTYSYKSVDGYVQTGDTVNSPVLRTLQDRLDDIVSVRAFGATGDGSDQTDALQRAIDQLYLNAANKGTPSSRVILHLEPGIYQISRTLYLPPFATIRGAGIDKTYIQSTVNAFETVNDESTPGAPANDATSTTANQAREIELSGMTIQSANAIGLLLQSCKESKFTDLKFMGTWDFGDAVRLNQAIKLQSLSTLVSCNNNVFERIEIENYSDGIYSDFDIKENIFENIRINNVDIGIYFGYGTTLGTTGQTTGPSNNKISNCVFDNVYREGINIVEGFFNLSQNNIFKNVGNHGGTEGNAQTSIINFNKPNNTSDNDQFNRTAQLSLNPLYFINYPYIPEITGTNISVSGFPATISIGNNSSFEKTLRFSADTAKSYLIDYIYTSDAVNAKRTGKIEMMIDPANNDIQITDEYVYVGDTAFDENLKFNAELYDENSDGTVDTAALTMLNSTSGDSASFSYKVTIKQ